MEKEPATLSVCGKRYLTVHDIRAKFRVSRPTVYRWVKRNIIPHFYIGASDLRFDPEKIDAWVAERQSDAK